jgi:two-component system sensor histidine kinase and response regulator WspE
VTDSGGQDYSDVSMLHLFCMEAEVQTGLLNDGLLTLERDPQNAESLEVLMRAAHSLKGAARIVQLSAAERVAHVMEDCFVAAQEGRVRLVNEHVEVLLHGVDMLTRIAQVAETAEADELAALHTELDTLVTAITAIVTPGAAPPPAVSPRQKVSPPPASEVPSTASPADIAPAQDEPAPIQNMPVPAQTRSVLASDESAPAQTKPVPASAESAVAPPTPRDSADKGRVVRVTAENLNRLMGLAGESLVESRWLEPFAGSLRQLKRSQVELSDVLERLRELLAELDMPERAEEHWTTARRMLDECRHTLSDRLTELELFARRSENLSDRLYREAIASRMRPFDDGVQGFPRMVRDIARTLGKGVKLEILGRATEVDRDILERLEAPVSHLLRNAIDHGVEPPEQRLAVGKDAEGTIRLEAGYRGGMLSITVSDDGQGVDLEELRKKIVSKQLTTAEMAESLTEAELMDFLFLPAFFTKEQVTEISGRGVGLGVVHDLVQEVSGTVRAISEPGRGMHFLLQLPLPLSVLRTLLVDIAGEPYAFPLARIDRAFMLPKDDIDIVADRQYFTMDGQHIGLVLAHQVLEVQEPTAQAEALSVIVVSDRSNCYGLVVDRFLGESDLVVQPLDPRLGKVPDVSAAALMENGSPTLIIDVEDMVRSVDNLLFGRRMRKVGRTTSEMMAIQRKRVLVVDDSITVREVERQLLENHGYEVEVLEEGMIP